MTKHLEPFWTIFRTMAIPPSSSAYVISSMHEAYYAGASSVFAIMMDMLDKTPSNEDGGKFLSELEQELISFMERSIKDRQAQKKGDSHAG